MICIYKMTLDRERPTAKSSPTAILLYSTTNTGEAAGRVIIKRLCVKLLDVWSWLTREGDVGSHCWTTVGGLGVAFAEQARH